MRILVNGEDVELDDGVSVARFLEMRGMTGRRIAVERNGEIVPRSEHRDCRLQDGDRVEIVQAIGGGASNHDSGCTA
ncbi:MAG TPA: sulfur carrier protein ThiS [Gammaproteobacteria bacterium]|nr:sulfur carrier protein ThiS [Gammaproteobacteria bacterium]